VKDHHFMPPVGKKLKGAQGGPFVLHQKIRNEDHEPRARQAKRHLAKGVTCRGLARGGKVGEGSQEGTSVTGPSSGWEPSPDTGVKGRDPDPVSLSKKEKAEGCGQVAGHPELGRQGAGTRCPSHRPGGIEEQVGRKMRFFFELLHEEPVRTPNHAPVHMPQVVAWSIAAELSKLRREAASCRTMQPEQEPIGDPRRQELEPPELGQELGGKKVGARARGRGVQE